MKKRARPCEDNPVGKYQKKQRIRYMHSHSQSQNQSQQLRDALVLIERMKREHHRIITAATSALKQDLAATRTQLKTVTTKLKQAKTHIKWQKRELEARIEGNYKVELTKQLTEMRKRYESELCTQERHYQKIIAGLTEKDIPMSIYG